MRLARRALDEWGRLEAEAGEPLLLRTGTLDLGLLAQANEPVLAACKIPFERLTGRQLAARWPLSARPDEHALYQSDGGIILADRALRALADGVRAAGGTIRPGTRVVRVEAGDEGVRVVTPDGDLTSVALVVTAGAWARELIRPLGIALDVTATRETVAYLDLAGASELPPLLDSTVPPGSLEGGARISFSLAAPGTGLKGGVHHAGPTTDPEREGAPDLDTVAWVEEWVVSRYPGARRGAAEPETCLYTSTPDERFVLERHGRIVVGSACSGHGFKFAPVLGQMLAELAADALATSQPGARTPSRRRSRRR